jgi:hypothetical protein
VESLEEKERGRKKEEEKDRKGSGWSAFLLA